MPSAARNHAPSPEGEVTLRGEVIRCRILGDAFWGVAEVRPLTSSAEASAGAESTKPIAVTGKLLGVSAGDTVEVLGSWQKHPSYGDQLRARSIKTVVPSDNAGVVAWLAGKLPGVGRGRAAEIVAKFGTINLDDPSDASGAAAVWRIIEEQPHRLLEIRGITPAMVEQITEAYESSRGDRDRIVRLRGWGLTDNQVARVVAKWKTRAEEILRANPYRLAEEIPGFGFKRADEVAQRMGLPHESPARIRAAVEWCIESAEGDGHCYVPAHAVAQWVAKEARVRAERVEHEIREMTQEAEAEDGSDGGEGGNGGENPEDAGSAETAGPKSRGRVVLVLLTDDEGRPIDDGVSRIARVATARVEEQLGRDAVLLARGTKRAAHGWELATEGTEGPPW